jgi:hypothetical protein
MKEPNTGDKEFDPQASEHLRDVSALTEWSWSHMERPKEVDTRS